MAGLQPNFILYRYKQEPCTLTYWHSLVFLTKTFRVQISQTPIIESSKIYIYKYEGKCFPETINVPKAVKDVLATINVDMSTYLILKVGYKYFLFAIDPVTNTLCLS